MSLITGYTGKLSVNDGSSNADQDFANTVNVSIPGGKTKIIDFVELNQGDRFVQKIPAMIDSGEIKFKMNYNATDCARLFALRGLYFITGTTPTTWIVHTSDSSPATYTFTGILSEFEPGELDAEAGVVMSGTIAISGAITVA